MTRAQSKRIATAGAAITVHSAASSLPSPTAGASVAGWNHDTNGCIEMFELTITGSTTISLTSAKLYAIEGGVAYFLADLNGGNAISLTTTLGFRCRLHHSPLTSAYALSGSLSAGNVTVTVRPIREVE